MLSKYIVSLIILAFLHSAKCYRSFMHGRPYGGFVGQPAELGPHQHVVHIREQWTKQRLDNFNSKNTNTWQNRYFVNQMYYESGGPVFLLLRGEDRASAEFMVSGAWIEYAKEYGALCFQLEHRFYGKSYPTTNMSTENFRYLSSEQALADAANFIKTMTKLYKIQPNQKWVVFGGSYAGALSVWLADTYPKLNIVVVSSSGPINPTVNFVDYLNSVSSVIKTHSKSCADQVEKAFEIIRQKLKSRYGQKSLTHTLTLCNSAEHADDLDISNLLFTLAGNFMYIVQYNNVNNKGSNLTLDEACHIMNNIRFDTTPLTQFKKVNKLLLKEMHDGCVDFKYHKVINQMRNTTLSSDVAYGGTRQWTYQTCNEFGFFQTSESTLQIFGNEFPLEFFINQCRDIFGPFFNLPKIKGNVQKTNLYYGGLRPNVQNVLCVQGSADPWHTVGYTKNLTTGMQALFVDGTAHCADMYQPRPQDSIYLKQARKHISQYIGNAINATSSESYEISSVQVRPSKHAKVHAKKHVKAGQAGPGPLQGFFFEGIGIGGNSNEPNPNANLLGQNSDEISAAIEENSQSWESAAMNGNAPTPPTESNVVFGNVQTQQVNNINDNVNNVGGFNNFGNVGDAVSRGMSSFNIFSI